MSLLLSWVFNDAKGSVLLAMLAHASVNTGGLLVASPRSARPGFSVVLMVLLVGAILTVATHGKLGYRPGEGWGRAAMNVAGRQRRLCLPQPPGAD